MAGLGEGEGGIEGANGLTGGGLTGSVAAVRGCGAAMVAVVMVMRGGALASRV